MKLKFKPDDLVKLVKIGYNSDSNYGEGCHPNNIEKDYITYGYIFGDDSLKVGNRFYLYSGKGFNFNFTTSKIIEILSDDTFKTKNSIYKLEFFKLEK